jgi:hypothetical protein
MFPVAPRSSARTRGSLERSSWTCCYLSHRWTLFFKEPSENLLRLHTFSLASGGQKHGLGKTLRITPLIMAKAMRPSPSSRPAPASSPPVATTIALAPPKLRAGLDSLCQLPIFEFGGPPRITAVFWSEGEYFQGPEPWPSSYTFGGEIFRSELLDEETWLEAFAEERESHRRVAEGIVKIARRSLAARPVVLSRQEMALLIPPDSKHRNEAIKELLDGGIFETC